MIKFVKLVIYHPALYMFQMGYSLQTVTLRGLFHSGEMGWPSCRCLPDQLMTKLKIFICHSMKLLLNLFWVKFSQIKFPLQVIRMLEEDNNRLERPDACPEQTYSLMLQCWDLTPEKRPTFAELHNIFSTNPFYADVKLPLKDKSTS